MNWNELNWIAVIAITIGFIGIFIQAYELYTLKKNDSNRKTKTGKKDSST